MDTGRRGEAAALAKTRERVLLPALRGLAQGLVDWHLPVFGGAERFAVVSLAKTYPHEARRVASALWGSTMLGGATLLVVVDAGVDVRNVEAVLGQIAAHVDAARDSFTYDGPARSSSGDANTALSAPRRPGRDDQDRRRRSCRHGNRLSGRSGDHRTSHNTLGRIRIADPGSQRPAITLDKNGPKDLPRPVINHGAQRL